MSPCWPWWPRRKARPTPPGEEGEETANKLSVPAIFVPSTAGSPFTGTCDGTDNSADPVPPKGVDTDGDTIPDEHLEYYVQGVTSWQADCDIAAAGTITASAEWGDNLTNAPLKATTPIRVEIGFLTDPETAMSGYLVEKLDPTLLDRLSHYGTLGNEVADYPEVRVWDSGVTLSIVDSDGSVVFSGPFVAEVNSTGRIVYGFNWQNPVPGTYTITVTAPNITISSADAGTVVNSHTVTLEVTVGNKGGGGGGKGGKGGGGGPDLGGGGGGGGGPGGPN